MNINWFLEYVYNGDSKEIITSMYIGCIETILNNSQKPTSRKQIKMLNDLRKNYNEAITEIQSKES